jgi:environmental stress-induced protein Ves
MVRRLGPEDYRDTPWKNGGGVTRELLRVEHPSDPARFFVRLSIATVASSGPFSEFAGVDRTLVLLEGDGMVLSCSEGPDVVLDRPMQTLSFAGESRVSARLLGGPTRDFNLMVDRAVGWATLRVARVDGEAPLPACPLALVHALEGALEAAGEALRPGETLVLEPQTAGALRGRGLALVIQAWRHEEAPRAPR